MKILLDSSVLVPALVPSHPCHELCYPYLKAAKERQTTAYIFTHSLAEVYSVITRLPVKPRPTPTQAQTLLTDLLTYTLSLAQIESLGEALLELTDCSDLQFGYKPKLKRMVICYEPAF